MTTSDSPRIRRDLHPAVSEKTESMLAARQVDYVLEPNLAIAAIRTLEGHQVRLADHRAPKNMVERYAEQMKRGAVFPAIVVTEGYELIDGNTRCAAATRHGASTIPAYVCSGMSSLETRSLSIELNQTHGLRMTDEEIRRFVISCVQSGVAVDVDAYARITGVKAASLVRWIGVERFRVRAANLGVSATETGLSDSAAVALQSARLDAVFSAATALATGTEISAAEIRAVVMRANAATSEAEALEIVARERATRSAVDRPTCPSATARRSRGSALHLGGLLRFGVDDLLDVAPEKQREMHAGLCIVRDLLDAAVTAAEATWEMKELATMSSPELLEVA
jgi:hypothetical protein